MENLKQSSSLEMQWLKKEDETNKRLKANMHAQRLREKHYKEVKVVDYWPEFMPASTKLLVSKKADPEKAVYKFRKAIEHANNPLKK